MVYCVGNKNADVAQWQSARFPSQIRGFDSRHLLQSPKECFLGACFFCFLCYTVDIVGETGEIPVRARRREVHFLFFLYSLVAKGGQTIEAKALRR